MESFVAACQKRRSVLRCEDIVRGNWPVSKRIADSRGELMRLSARLSASLSLPHLAPSLLPHTINLAQD